jgi:hypothetical protein
MRARYRSFRSVAATTATLELPALGRARRHAWVLAFIPVAQQRFCARERCATLPRARGAISSALLWPPHVSVHARA